MKLLYFLEQFRSPFMTQLMLAVTHLGEETVFLVIALIVFWCVDKKRGYYILLVGFAGTIASQFLKLAFKVPRPWVLDPNFSIVEQAREAASGYSFPSGHTQSAASVFGALAYSSRKKWAIPAAVLPVLAVAFSRMYLGVHTPYDVSAAAVIAFSFVAAVYPAVMQREGRYILAFTALLILFSIAFLAFVEYHVNMGDLDAEHIVSAQENAYTLLGCILGLLTSYYADAKWIHFSTDAVWWGQILKVLGGLVVLLIVKQGTQTLFDMLSGGDAAANLLQYFLVVITAGVFWPLCFSRFVHIRKKEM